MGRQNSRRGGSSRTEAGESVDGLELTNDDGMTALMLAAQGAKKDCCALLVKYGAIVKAKASSAHAPDLGSPPLTVRAAAGTELCRRQ
jgi:ankyrin repeat protein